MSKQYIEGKVTYGAAGRRWTFKADSGYQYSTPIMPGGAETAHKVARVINGSVKRSATGELDNLGRANMNQIFHRAAKATSRVVNHLGLFA